MNPLVDINLGFYFEIKNSEMFGGKDSTGYISVIIGGIKNIETVDDDFVNQKIQDISNAMNVPKEDVRLISKEEYAENTEIDSEGFEGDEYGC